MKSEAESNGMRRSSCALVYEKALPDRRRNAASASTITP